MEKILFINACIRPDSRTLELANCILENLSGTVEEVKLFEKPLSSLTSKEILRQCFDVRKTKIILPDKAAGCGHVVQIFGFAQAFGPALVRISKGDTGNRDIFQIDLQHSREHQIPIRCRNHDGICRSKLLW